jgi:uncharacterized protein with FMN-binding domain
MRQMEVFMLKKLMSNLKRKLALCMVGILISTSFVVPASAAVGYSYTDGEYNGTGTGHGGDLSAVVTVSGSAITAIAIGENKETPPLLENAKGVIDEIIAKQSTDVDVISGATQSSRAIIDAVEDALSQAYTGIFKSGDGTAKAPFVIASAEQLEHFRDSVNEGETYKDQFIVLEQDIDIGGIEWTPINGFAGTFNGAGNVIRGLTIGSQAAGSQTLCAGLFGTLEASAAVKNLGLEDAVIYVLGGASAYAGGLAGKTNNGGAGQGTIVDNCYVTGTMISSETDTGALSFAGGLVGYLGSYSTVANSFTDIPVHSKAGGTFSSYAGGLSGMTLSNTAVVNCYTMGEVTGSSCNTNMGTIIGGLFGMQGGKSYNCYSLSNITVNNIKADGSSQPTAYTPAGVLAGQVTASGQMDTMYYGTDSTITLNGVIQAPIPSVGKGASNAIPTNITGITTEEAASESLAQILNNGLKSVSIGIPAGISLYGWELAGGRVSLSGTIYANPDIGSNIFAGGEGTRENPYLIETEKQLRDFAVSLNDKIDYAGRYIRLAGDIDVSSDDWIPVGEGEYIFNGTFDGGGFEIKGLKYGTKDMPKNADNYFFVALFGVVGEHGLVKNLGLTDVGLYTTGKYSINTAAIAGYLEQGGIDNCYAEGTAIGRTTTAGNNYVGGLVGNQYLGYIINSWADVEVRSEAMAQYGSEAGGLVSLNNRGLIANCYTLGDASGDAVRAAEGMAYVSNLAACQAGTMINCYVLGDTVSDSYSYYVGAISGMTTGIGKGYLSYYNTEALQKIDNRVPKPFVAVGTTVSTTEDGVNVSGFNYGLAGFTLAKMKSATFAETLNNNFKSFPVDLSQWLPGEATLKTWYYDEAKNQVILTDQDADINYVPIIIKEDNPAAYKAGTYYGSSGETSEFIVSVTVTKDKITDLSIINQKDKKGDYSDILDAVITAQSTKVDYEKGNDSITKLLKAIDTALKKAAAGDTAGYGLVDPGIFAGGNGTKENPYKIATARQLTDFAVSINEDESYDGKYIALTADISLSGLNWIPAGGGNGAHAFCGTFDGRGHTVDAMAIGSDVQPEDYQYTGLFGYLNHAIIKNLNLTNVDINNHYSGNGRDYAGVLAGAIETGTCIDSCSAKGKLSSQAKSMSYVGGLIGYTSGLDSAVSYITNSFTDVEVTGISDTSWIYAGGISGLNNRTYIINSYSLGNVTGNSTNNMNRAAAGGIAGLQGGYIRNCYSLGNITALPATTDVGGYAGRHTGIANTYYAYYNTDSIHHSGNTLINPVQGAGVYTPSSTTGLIIAEHVEGKTKEVMTSMEFAALLNENQKNSNVAVALPQGITLKPWVYNPVLKLAVLTKASTDNSGGDTGNPGNSGNPGTPSQDTDGKTVSGSIPLEGINGTVILQISEVDLKGSIKASIKLPAAEILNQIKESGLGGIQKVTIPINSDELIKRLKETETKEVNIAIAVPDSLRNNKAFKINLELNKQLFEAAEAEGKTITATITDEKGKDVYSWNFNGDNLKKSKRTLQDVNLSLELREIQKEKGTIKISENDAKESSYGFGIDFFHEGLLPAQAEVKLYIGDLLGTENGLKAGSRVYLYHINEKTKKLDILPNSYQYTVDKEGYLTIDLIHCSDYAILTQKADNSLVTPLLKQITVTPAKAVLYAGGKVKDTTIKIKLPDTLELVNNLKDQTTGSAAEGVTVTYQSGNKTVAVVDKGGRITAKKPGTAKITTTITLSNGKSRKVTGTILVKKPYLKFTNSIKIMKVGDNGTFKVKGYGADLSKAEWSAGNKGVIVVDKLTGKVTAKATGVEYVTVKAGNISIKTRVTVK